MVAKSFSKRHAPKSLLCFNPCSGGLWLLSLLALIVAKKDKKSFNPCSGGLWLLSEKQNENNQYNNQVSILVLVDYGC